MKKIHHLSLVTTDIDLALNILNLNRSDIKETILDAQQKNKFFLVYNESNDLWIEFVLPMDKTSTTYNFAKKFGLALHHIAFSSDDLTKTEKDFASRPKVFKIGNYRNYDIKSFGGSISILFFAIKGLIVEFVAKRKNNE